jgi:hypothetical protein
MSETFIELAEEQFDEQFPLVINHLNPNASWSFGDGQGCLFETYGDELEFIRQQDPNRVWTFVDGDDGDHYVISGIHFVNRIGYLLARDPIPDNTLIEVRIPRDCHDEPEDDEEQP